MVAAVTRIRPGTANLLRTSTGGGAGVDVAAATLPTNPGECVSGGGWTVTTSTTAVVATVDSGAASGGGGGGTQGAFYALTSGLPRMHGRSVSAVPSHIQPGMQVPFRPLQSVARAMRLSSAAAGGAAVGRGRAAAVITITTNQSIAVAPAAQLVLTGWIRTNGLGEWIVHTDWEDFEVSNSI